MVAMDVEKNLKKRFTFSVKSNIIRVEPRGSGENIT